MKFKEANDKIGNFHIMSNINLEEIAYVISSLIFKIRIACLIIRF